MWLASFAVCVGLPLLPWPAWPAWPGAGGALAGLALAAWPAGQAVDQAKAAVRVTDDYVHDHPWASVGVAAAIGFVFGVLLTRR